jgi:phenylacetate-CoA ligase
MYSYYNKEAETLPREKLRELQSRRLIATVKRVYENNQAYKKKFDDAGIKPGDVRSVDDLKHLPFTYKQDLRDNYPFGLFSAPMDEVVRIHASSGTTGKQTVVGYTKSDMEVWGEVMARTIGAGGVTRKDIGHISYGYGLFTGGLGGNLGSETIGCATIPASTGNTKRQVMILQDFKPTFILCTPSYALTLAEYIEENNIPKEQFALKYGFFGAEPWTEAMRAEIERRLHLEAFDIYGLSEVIGPGVAYECQAHKGLHVSEDHFIPEIIDPDTGEVLPDGEKGELVFTCITKEALPLIRYRTRDVAAIIKGDCPCGRTHLRMTKPAGRTDDMLIIRGVNVFPSQVESVLLEIDGIGPHYQMVVERNGNLDSLTIHVELSESSFTGEVRKLEALRGEISKAINSTLGIAADIKLADPKSIERFEGKAKRVIDKRKLLD